MEHAALTIVWWALLCLLLRLILMPFNLTFAVREHFHRIKTESARKAQQNDTDITKVGIVNSALGIACMNTARTKPNAKLF